MWKYGERVSDIKDEGEKAEKDEKSADPPAVLVKNLSKVFPVPMRREKVLAVDNISFEVPAGSVYGLIGPNGSGKSTTMKVLLGLISGREIIWTERLESEGARRVSRVMVLLIAVVAIALGVRRQSRQATQQISARYPHLMGSHGQISQLSKGKQRLV